MKKHFNFPVVIALLVVFLCLTCHAGLPEKTIVAGHIDNLSEKSSRVITAIDCNPSSISGRHAVKIDSAGNFKTYVNLLYGHNFTIYYNGRFICAYAEPGDSIHLEINADNPGEGTVYYGSHADLNNGYSPAYSKLFDGFYDELPSEQMSLDEYIGAFKNRQEVNMRNIARYADSVGLAPDCRDLIERTALFTLANSAITYKGRNSKEKIDFFAAPLFGLDDPENAREMMFPYHILAYLNRLEDAAQPSSPQTMLDIVAARHPKGFTRDIMLVILSKSPLFEDKQIPVELFADPDMHQAIYEKEESVQMPMEKLTDGKMFRCIGGEFTRCDATSLSELLLHDYAGKIVYLDLWATWCGPCRVAHKSLPEVAEFFKDRDDLVFVGVAMKSNMEQWKKAVAGLPSNCHNYIVTSDDDAEMIMSFFGMSGFPTLRIIGRQGSIINNNPPRFQSPAIFDTLQEFTGEKQGR